MFPRIARHILIIIGVVATLLLSAASPIADASTVEASDSTLDNPRHTVPVIFGPYRVKIPDVSKSAITLTAEIEPPGPQWTPEGKYQIQSGDTLSKLASPSALGFSVQDIASVSGIPNVNRLSVGQWLCKPGVCPVPAPPVPAAPASQVAAVTASGTASAVIQFAMSQIGDPYVWGGNGPNGWDCSGLMVGAFRTVGISLPRTSRAQFGVGISVGRDALAPGDLLFFGSSAGSIHHVALYIGNDQIIHASTYGVPVGVSSVSGGGRDYFGAKRVL